MIRGLRTIIYMVDDLTAATLWYEKIVGHVPYFNETFYVGFNVGGFELGLQPDEGKGVARGNSPKHYWAVDDVDAAWRRLIEMGATPSEAIQDVGGGVRLAVVKDPWGNDFGIILNPHFKFDEKTNFVGPAH